MGKLTAAKVQSLRAPGKHIDGHGLALHVAPHGGRYWMFRFKRDGRERTMSLGSADVIGLAEARKLHTEARAMLAKGIDPLAQREQMKAAKAVTVSFAEAALAYIAEHKAGWRGERTAGHWGRSLATHAAPVFGAKSVAEISRDDVRTCLAPIWTVTPEMAGLLRGRIELVLDYAIGRGWRTAENPARWRGGLKMLLPAKAKVHTVEHHAALDWREAPALLAKLADDPSMAAAALRFLMLTAARSGEVRGATWGEIDPAAGLWSLPAARTKANRPHRVPLSEPVLELLRGLAEVRNGDLVFIGQRRGRPLADRTLRLALARLSPGVTVHGMRSTFRDWCADQRKPFDLAEAALAHVTGNAVVQAYQRSDLLDARRGLMAEWAAFLTRPPAVVVPIRVAG
jgi:integrase